MLKVKLFNYKENNNNIINLHKNLTGNNINEKQYILTFYDKNEFVGYTILIFFEKEGKVKIDWIYGPGYGKEMMKLIEKHLKKMKMEKIILNCSIDPNENKASVMKRMNFYISLQYKVYDIQFRKKYGPLLLMEKNL